MTKLPIELSSIVYNNGMITIDDKNKNHICYANFLAAYKSESTQGSGLQINSTNKEINREIHLKCNKVSSLLYDLQDLIITEDGRKIFIKATYTPLGEMNIESLDKDSRFSYKSWIENVDGEVVTASTVSMNYQVSETVSAKSLCDQVSSLMLEIQSSLDDIEFNNGIQS